MNRIDSLFEKLKESQKKAFVAYVVAGDPNLENTEKIVLSLEKSGADLIELGIPFSDPLADGIVNQQASQRALESQTTIPGILECIRKIRTTSQIPIVFFTYYNPIFHYGLDKFLTDAEKAGADGVLILDLPPEEADKNWTSKTSLKRISLIAPTTPDHRIREITSHSSGFIYYVSREGVTGMQDSLPENITTQIAKIRSTTNLPICVGFGISKPEQAKAVSQTAEGVVIGSAIVNTIAQNLNTPDLCHHLETFVTPLAEAIHQS